MLFPFPKTFPGTQHLPAPLPLAVLGLDSSSLKGHLAGGAEAPFTPVFRRILPSSGPLQATEEGSRLHFCHGPRPSEALSGSAQQAVLGGLAVGLGDSLP